MLAAFVVLVPTWFYLVLPRPLGMTLFALESLSPWAIMVLHEPVPTRILAGFILWSVLELPMYGFEVLGKLDRAGRSTAPRRPRVVPTFLLLWLLALGVAYSMSYVYRDSTPMTQYPKAVWVVAYLFLPLPPLIAARHYIRRVFRQEQGQSSS